MQTLKANTQREKPFTFKQESIGEKKKQGITISGLPCRYVCIHIVPCAPLFRFACCNHVFFVRWFVCLCSPPASLLR